MQYLLFPVSKGHILHFDIEIFRHKIRPVFVQGWNVHDVIQPVQGSLHRAGNGGHTARHLHGGIDHEAGHEKQQALLRRDASSCQKIGRKNQDSRPCELEHRLIERRHFGKRLFKHDICLFAFLDCGVNCFSGALRQPKRLDYAHALHIFQNGSDQASLGCLTAGRVFPADLADKRINKERHSKSGQRDQPDPPLIDHKPNADHDGVDKPARHIFHNGNGLLLQIAKCGRHRRSDIPEPVFIEIAHRRPFQAFADLHALFRPEREAAKRSGIGRKIDKHDSPCNGNDHDAKRDPDRAFRHNIAGKLLQDSCEHC